MPVDVQRYHRSFGILYYATGTEEEVHAWCENLVASFDPREYGTSYELAGYNEDGSVTFKAFRFLTCERLKTPSS